MSNFVEYRWKESGIVQSLPAHFAEHPIYGPQLEVYNADDAEYEEDKVVIAGHATPVEQRAVTVARPLDDMNVEELKTILRGRGLSTSGNKEELHARIAEDNHTDDEDN